MPTRFVFPEAVAQLGSGAAPFGAASDVAAAERRRWDTAGATQRWDSERSRSEDDDSELSSDEDEDDLWEEMDTPGSPPSANTPAGVYVWGEDAGQLADGKNSFGGVQASVSSRDGSAESPSTVGAAGEAATAPVPGGNEEAQDPIPAAVAIVGVRTSPKEGVGNAGWQKTARYACMQRAGFANILRMCSERCPAKFNVWRGPPQLRCWKRSRCHHPLEGIARMEDAYGCIWVAGRQVVPP